jgi:RHS repeat-associated protein
MNSDPTPGDPDRVRELAEKLQTFADDASDALGKVRDLVGDDSLASFVGQTAEAFKDRFDKVPPNLTKLHTSYDLAAQALARYWPKLEDAQRDADSALTDATEAKSDLDAAQSVLSAAATSLEDAEEAAEDPDEDAVASEVRRALTDAETAHSSAQGDVEAAQSRLEAAKGLAQQAKEAREEAAEACANDLDEASDAGMQNKKWWQKAVDWVVDNWDTIVEIAKIVVAVLGVIVMIIGGPLAWIVLAAALIVLADTLIDYANGNASLWDVAFAALDCIPGMKGLTTAAGLMKGLKTGMKGLAAGAKGLGNNVRKHAVMIVKRNNCGDPVDVASGELFMSATDVVLPGILPLVVERHHISSYRDGRYFGRSWASTLDQRLRLDATEVRFLTADGMSLVYPVPLPDPGNPVLPVEGPRWGLAWDGIPGTPLTVHQPESGRTLHFAPVPGRPAAELPVTAITDRNDNRIDFRYDDEGALTELVHSGGYRLGVAVYDGRVTSLTLLSDPAEPVLLAYDYDDAGDLAKIYNSSGLPLLLEYDDRHRLARWEDRNGIWYRYEYDDAGRCVFSTGTDRALEYRYRYDSANFRTHATDSLGHTTVFQFNDSYQLTARTDPLGNTVRQVWDRYDRLRGFTDALGNTTSMDWDEQGNLLAVRLPNGTASTARFNELRLPVELTSHDGAVWRQEWDERGNCLAVTTPDGATTTFTRDRTGALASLTDATGAVLRRTNSAVGLPVSVTDPLGAETRYRYDSFGRAVAVTDDFGAVISQSWTVEGLLASRSGPDGATESWSYDGEGNLLAHTDALGHVTGYTHTFFDLIASRTTPDGATYTFGYDTELRLTTVTNPQGHAWEYVYDEAGRLAAETDFDGRTLRYRYDAAGNLLSSTNPAGQTIAYRYDSLGQVISKAADGREITYELDAGGRILRAADPHVTLTRRYDRSGRVTEEAVNGRTLTTVYDALGRPVERTTPAGATTDYRYDPAGNRAALTASGHPLHFAHDALGRETSRQLGTGGPRLTTSWDAADRITAQTLAAPGADRPVQHRDYGYREDGSLTTLADAAAGTREFSFNATGRITGVRAEGWNETYAYDDLGNQTEASWPERQPQPEARGERQYAGNRVTRAGSVHYEYDAAGRAVVRRKTRLSRKPDIWRYEWDAEDLLTSVITPDGTTWRYLYDALRRRVAKQRLAEDGESVAEETRFVWDGPHLVEQTTRIAGSPEEHTLSWDRDGMRPVTQTERTTLADAPEEIIAQRFFAIVTDPVGAPTELVTDTGEIAWRAHATLWGLTTWQPDASTTTPLRFPGQYYDPETELHYNYFRHYDPATATYLSSDPLGLDAGPNPRAYVFNPLAWVDYLGLLTCKQNADILRRNMAREGRAPAPGQAAAHIVPSGLNRGGAANSRALMQRYGVDINDAANGIPLGHHRPHNFTHRKNFINRVDAHLQDTATQMAAAGRSKDEIAGALRDELRTIGRAVESELATGAPGPGAYWTA